MDHGLGCEWCVHYVTSWRFAGELGPKFLGKTMIRFTDKKTAYQAAIAVHGLKFDDRLVAASFVNEQTFQKLFTAILKEDVAVNGLASPTHATSFPRPTYTCTHHASALAQRAPQTPAPQLPDTLVIPRETAGTESGAADTRVPLWLESSGTSDEAIKAGDAARLSDARQHQPDEIIQDVTHDLAKATASMEKTVMLKLKKGACNLRLRAVAGEIGLGEVPEKLSSLSKSQVEDVITFLLTQTVSVMEVEPEQAKDEEEHLKLLEYLVNKKYALVVLDTEEALMYLVPPVPEAGKLLPNSMARDKMLGVLVVADSSAAQSSSAQSNAGASSHTPINNAGSAVSDQVRQWQSLSYPALPQSLSYPAVSSNNASGRGHMPQFADGGVAAHSTPHFNNTAGASQPPHAHLWMHAAEPPRIPAPLSVHQRILHAAPHSTFDPSSRPADAHTSLPSPSMPSPWMLSMPAPGLPAHAAAWGGWGSSPQREHEGAGGWRLSGDQEQKRFVGDVANPDQRHWQQPNDRNFRNPAPQNPPGYGMHGGQGNARYHTSAYDAMMQHMGQAQQHSTGGGWRGRMNEFGAAAESFFAELNPSAAGIQDVLQHAQAPVHPPALAPCQPVAKGGAQVC